MVKARKRLLGIIGLLLVALMTVLAYFLPTENAFAKGAGTDTVQVVVHSSTTTPAVEISSPATGVISTSPLVTTAFTFDNTSYVEVWLGFDDDEGNPQSIQLPSFSPNGGAIDPNTIYTGDGSVTINLAEHSLSYNDYILTLKSVSSAGYDEDSIEFFYIPSNVKQSGTDKETNDPIIDIEYDAGVGKIEIMPVDDEGNDLFDKPVSVIVEPGEEGYESGSKSVTLPFASYGLESGGYTIFVTAYSVTGEGDDVEYEVLFSPVSVFEVEYTSPSAPSVPDTGVFSGGTSIARTDLIATAIIIFVSILIFISVTVLRPKKKNYRKNIRSRK